MNVLDLIYFFKGSTVQYSTVQDCTALLLKLDTLFSIPIGKSIPRKQCFSIHCLSLNWIPSCRPIYLLVRMQFVAYQVNTGWPVQGGCYYILCNAGRQYSGQVSPGPGEHRTKQLPTYLSCVQGRKKKFCNFCFFSPSPLSTHFRRYKGNEETIKNSDSN